MNKPTVLERLQILIDPLLWFNSGYDVRTDAVLQKLLKNPVIQGMNEYTVRIKGVYLSYSNMPHSCGYDFDYSSINHQPSRTNKLRFTKLVRSHIKRNIQRTIELDMTNLDKHTERFNDDFCLAEFNMSYEEVKKTLEKMHPEYFV